MALDPKLAEQERLQREGGRIAFVVSVFHRELTSAMLESARKELRASGLRDEDMPVAWVPGAFELPIVARRFAQRAEIEAVICLGLVLKGETSHDVYVSHGAMQGILQVSLETDKPVLFGVLTCNTLGQAQARALPAEAGGEQGSAHEGNQDSTHRGNQDRGRELARAALQTLAALEKIDNTEEARDLGFPISPR